MSTTKPTTTITFVSFVETMLVLPLTRQWRVLLAVAIDGVEPRDLEGEEREIARRLFGPVDVIPPAARRLLVWTLGRGSGKSTLAMALAIFVAFTSDVGMCGPGDIPLVCVVAPLRRLSVSDIRIGRALIDRAPQLRDRIVREVEDGFLVRRFDNVIVEVAAITATRGGAAGRGRTILAVVLDESEFFTSGSDYAVTDADVLHALLPRLVADGLAILISTPWPVETMTSKLATQQGAPVTALAAIGPSTFMRPDDASLTRARELLIVQDPSTAAREFDCVREVAGEEQFLASADIDACVTDDPPDGPGTRYSGLDTGLLSDSTADTTFSALADGTFDVIAIEELRPTKVAPLKPSETFADRAASAKALSVWAVATDGHYIQSVREYYAAVHIPVVLVPGGATGKVEMHLVTKRMVRERRVRIFRSLPHCARLIGQLKELRATKTAGGGVSITSPRRRGEGHGDVASAFVAGLWLAAKYGPALDAKTAARDEAQIFANLRAANRSAFGSTESDEDDSDAGRAWGGTRERV